MADRDPHGGPVPAPETAAGHHDTGPVAGAGGGSSAAPVDEDTLAARRRTRARRRQSIVFVAIFLVVLGIGIGAAGVNRGWWAGPFAVDEPTAAAPTEACPTPTTVPVEPATIQVSVLNATSTGGLAGSVAQTLGERGVEVVTVANAPEGTQLTGAAEIRFGPEGERSAQGLASLAPGADLALDEGRAGPAVDLVLGPGWTEVAPVDTPLTATVAPDPTTLPPACRSGAATAAPTG